MRKQKGVSMGLIWIVGVVLLLLMLVAVFAPRPVDWSYSFSQQDPIPFGNSLLYNSLPELFPGGEVTVSRTPWAGFGDEREPERSTGLIFINRELHFSASAVKELLQAAANGHHIFMAAQQTDSVLADTLGLTIENPRPSGVRSLLLSDSVSFNFANNRLKTVTGYWYSRHITSNYFVAYDTARTTVLGHDHHGRTNFIRIRHGEGAILFNANPLAFTNYHLLKSNHAEYIFKALSYLPEAPVVWDEYYKPRTALNPGLFNYVLEKPALKVAWYIIIVLVVSYFIFESARRQRAIPVIRKPANTTISFVQSVARLYLSRQDHLNIARKRFTYFLEFLRSRYYINTSGDVSAVIAETALKSGIRERTVAALFKVAGNLNRVKSISAEDLEQFNRQIEFFYEHCE